MKLSFLNVLVCPGCHARLSFVSNGRSPSEPFDLEEGILKCEECDRTYPIVNSVPRFAPASNYADSFGYEWNLYGHVQIDSLSGNTISQDRFEATTGWVEGSMNDRLILDAGCGGGRFTECALRTGATVVAFDYSNCIDRTAETHGRHGSRVHFAQASIYEMPFRDVFDAVFCMGVLQHTPDPRASVRCLYDVVKPGGEFVVDVYLKEAREHTVRHLWDIVSNPQIWLWRPLLKRLPYRLVHRFIRWYVQTFLLLDNKVLAIIKARPESLMGKLLTWARRLPPVEIMNHCFQFPNIGKELWYLWAEMNTVDLYTPKYTQPQTAETMAKWGQEIGLENIEVFVKPGHGDGTGLVLRGRKPVREHRRGEVGCAAPDLPAAATI